MDKPFLLEHSRFQTIQVITEVLDLVSLVTIDWGIRCVCVRALSAGLHYFDVDDLNPLT